MVSDRGRLGERDRHDATGAARGRLPRARADANRADNPVRLRLVAPWIERADDDVFVFSGPDALGLSTPVDVAVRDRCAQADFVVSQGERVPFG
jgi:hypothetical protein